MIKTPVNRKPYIRIYVKWKEIYVKCFPLSTRLLSWCARIICNKMKMKSGERTNKKTKINTNVHATYSTYIRFDIEWNHNNIISIWIDYNHSIRIYSTIQSYCTHNIFRCCYAPGLGAGRFKLRHISTPSGMKKTHPELSINGNIAVV